MSGKLTCFNNITGLSAAGTTGTTSTNLVFSTSPTFVTPALGAATGTSVWQGSAAIPPYLNQMMDSAVAAAIGEFARAA